MKCDPNENPKTYFYHLALDLHSSFNAADLRLNSCVGSADIFGFCGVCQFYLEQWPEPVLIAFADDRNANGEDDDYAHLEAKQKELLVPLRNGLAKIGLEELACYDKSPPGYALVAQLGNPEHDLKKAARQLAKLVWDLAD